MAGRPVEPNTRLVGARPVGGDTRDTSNKSYARAYFPRQAETRQASKIIARGCSQADGLVEYLPDTT